LRERDTRGIVSDLESLARRQPAAFLSSAFFIGLLASRFLKSSRPAPELMYGMPDPKRALPQPRYSVQGSGSWPSSIPQSGVGLQGGSGSQSGVGTQSGAGLQSGAGSTYGSGSTSGPGSQSGAGGF
jgi:hypothetical protein